MAVRYAVATGNWSAVGTWNGGVSLPSAGDEVYANGYIISINQDITVVKISTEICPVTGVGGGRFTPSASGRVLTCDIVSGTSYCVLQPNGYTVTYIGDIYGGSGASCFGVNAQNITTVIVIGDIYGGSGGLCYGVYVYNLSSGSITGNIYGGVTATDFGFFHDLSSVATISIVGDIIAGGAAAVRMSLTLNFVGNIYASSTSNGVFGSSVGVSTVANITGYLYNSNSKLAIGGYFNIYFSPSASTAWLFYSSDNVAKPLYTADVLENPPAESDTRYGVVYGIANNYTGTAHIPPKASVALNVPVDDTVWELVTATTPADFIAALKADDLGKRMGKCATTEEVDSTVRAYENNV